MKNNKRKENKMKFILEDDRRDYVYLTQERVYSIVEDIFTQMILDKEKEFFVSIYPYSVNVVPFIYMIQTRCAEEGIECELSDSVDKCTFILKDVGCGVGLNIHGDMVEGKPIIYAISIKQYPELSCKKIVFPWQSEYNQNVK